jgi:hypothetical protein
MSVAKVLYKPVAIALGAVGGALATAVFQQVWKALGHQEAVPGVTDEESRLGGILTAAALQGAISAVVKAIIERGGASGVRRVTGTWPA